MSIIMDEKEMRAFTAHMTKNIETEKDLNNFSLVAMSIVEL